MNKQKLIMTTMLVFFLCSVHSAFAFVSSKDRFELSIGGDIPVSVGAHLRYNWSTQYYTKLGAGFAIETLVDTHQNTLDWLAFSEKNRLLSSALINSVVFDMRIGWAKSIYEGTFIEFGYRLMLWGKGKVTGNRINSAIQKTNKLPRSSTYQVDILNHGPSAHLGYRFILTNQLTLNMDAGIYKPLFSSTHLDYGNIPVPAGESKKVNDIVIEKLWFLSIGIGLSLSF